MGIIKTFSEWLNESYSSVRTLTNNIYQAIVDAGLGSNFNKPEYDDESPWLTAQADAYDFKITDKVACIPFGESSTFDYDKYIFYGIYVTDEAPINDLGDTASVVIEYGEDDYTDGPEPWVLYYSAKEDKWDGNGPIKNPSSELANLICVISQAINPETKYHNYRSERSSVDDNYKLLADENCDVRNLYNYLIDHFESLGDAKIELESGKSEDGAEWNSVRIPITLSGEHIVTEVDAQNPSKIFAVDFTKGLKDDVLKTDYYEIDDENINDDGYERVFFSNDAVLCSEVVDFLDELLGLVSDPALRKK